MRAISKSVFFKDIGLRPGDRGDVFVGVKAHIKASWAQDSLLYTGEYDNGNGVTC